MSFKVDDEVQIVRAVPSGYNGWKNVWAYGMDSFVGNGIVYRIGSISSFGSGVSLYEIDTSRNSGYMWPIDALELVSTKPYARVIRKINAIDKIRKGLGYAF